MKNTYFISDVHLGELPPEKEAARVSTFLNFLKSLEDKAERIFFVGDIFDFWFEYKQAIPKKHFATLHQMARLREHNIELHYLPGNHDFWLGDFFDTALGIHTYENDWSGELNGKKFYLFHGDGIAKKDVGYRMLRRFLRRPLNIKLFRLLHPDWGIPFARFVSGSSRQYTNHIKLNDHSDYIEFAQQKFIQGYDYVLMGHRHNPIEHVEDGKKYINLGDWLGNYTYAVFDGKDLKLQKLAQSNET
jgi:UDP-2,3-diacylglucosamine hydrolase